MKYITNLLGAAGIGTIITAVGFSIWSSQYADNALLAWAKDYTEGKTKNGIATIVAEEIARDISDDADIDLRVRRTLWYDGTIIGNVNTDQGNVNLDDNKAVFESSTNQGKLTGKVRKNELDWKVEETDNDGLKITRWGPKWNSYLRLEAKDGFIQGRYDRRGWPFRLDWKIQGRYDENGNTQVKIKVPFGGDINLEGKIN